MSAVIKTEKLCKTYEAGLTGQPVPALVDLDLEIAPGEIFAYLGPNGSGKTTTIKLLLGLIFPTSGAIEILGKRGLAVPAVRKQVGYLPEGAYYPDFLRGEEVLRFYGQLYGLEGKHLRQRVDEVLDTVGMTRARKRLVRGYSKGMRQRIGLAQALVSDPQVLILDEPTTGLDPIARKEIRDILVQLRDAGKTLLISSHELLECELISDRAGILFEGRLQTLGTIDELLLERDTTIQVKGATAQALDQAKAAGAAVEDVVDDEAKLRVTEPDKLYAVLDACRAGQAVIVSVAPRRETLEELFVRVVGDAELAAAEQRGPQSATATRMGAKQNEDAEAKPAEVEEEQD